MKFRRALALAAATVVVAPAAILAAPAASATATDGTAAAGATGTPPPSEPGSPAASPDASATTPVEEPGGNPGEGPGGDTGDGTGEDSGEASASPGAGGPGPSTAPDESPGPTPSGTPGAPASPSASPSASSSESEDPAPPAVCATSDLDVSVHGLPGRIARGSGRHAFTMNVYNSSRSTVKKIDYFAGASSDRAGDDLFRSEQVSLQVRDPETGAWVELGEDGRAVGYVGRSDEMPPGYEVDIPLRIEVKRTAPVGAGFTLGAGLYVGDKDCVGVGDVAYRFRIVESGGSGSTPRTGGRAPVPSAEPAANPMGRVTGRLAETGPSSALPVFAAAGGAAVMLGAGAMYLVRRRGHGDADV
ncbi:LPXTG cell wall anchor domain-containing protein [Streptomyces sp. NPDC057697]|uniref:LPXTG cell wall anchor domain-containing protein n=1 Tax=Streptomyces sp. NPDC057697 TaxID=3346219 RepID=UPI0036BDBC52